MRVDGYIRVSRVGGRNGESFISPDEQRRAIEAYAAAHGIEVAEWHRDLDQSGGTLDRPGFQAALARCRRGETGGIIAAKLDRLTRSTVGLGTLIDEARSGGWNLIAVDFGLDLFSANGKLVADVLAAVAEWERTRRRDDWTSARANAIGRGVFGGSHVPLGYRRGDDGRLVVVEEEAAVVREAFHRRAAGESISDVARFLTASAVRPPDRRIAADGWAHSTVRQILTNDVYLGVVRSGEFVTEDAHPAIVTRAEYDAVRIAKTARPVPTGVYSGPSILLGVARCAGCGRTLKIVTRKRADGTHVSSYYCKNAASVACSSRAYVHVGDLDDLVERLFVQALRHDRRFAEAIEAEADLADARRAVEDAEYELQAFVTNASALDAKMFQAGIEARQSRLDMSRIALAETTARASRVGGLVGGNLSELWTSLDADEKRQILAAYLDRVVVRRGDADDLVRRVQIVWHGNVVADLPQEIGATVPQHH